MVCLSEYLPLRILHVHDSSISSMIYRRILRELLRRDYEYITSNRQDAIVSGMFVRLTVDGAPVGLVLVFAATRKEMPLRPVS